MPIGSPSAFVTWPDTILATYLADTDKDSIGAVRLRVYSAAADVATGRARTQRQHSSKNPPPMLTRIFPLAGTVSALFLTQEHGLITCMQYSNVVAAGAFLRFQNSLVPLNICSQSTSFSSSKRVVGF